METATMQTAHKLFLQGRLAAAQALLLPLVAAQPEHADALQILGLIAQNERKLETALAYLSRALQLEPGRADLLTNLGNILRALERFDAALLHLQQAAQLAPGHALIHINLGLVHQDLQQLPEAEAAFRAALAMQPGLACAHQNLGHLLMQSDLAQARAHLIRSLQLSPGMPAAFKDLCAVLISMKQAAPALALCTSRLRTAPWDQDALAIMALALRELGRDREAQALVDCDLWLQSQMLCAPPGYASLQQFNAELEAHVRAHPQLTSVLFGQATHHGKRINDVLAEPKGPIRWLEKIALQQSRACLHAWPAMSAHPYHGQAMPGATCLRCWAVLMERHGHETPHIHPDGLVSGVYYVRLPDVVAGPDAGAPGWIEFGEPDPVFATMHAAPTRKIQPVAGMMLLFPSYFWHRTVPFDSAQERLSIAFDLTPEMPLYAK